MGGGGHCRLPFWQWPELKLRWWTQTQPRLYRIYHTCQFILSSASNHVSVKLPTQNKTSSPIQVYFLATNGLRFCSLNRKFIRAPWQVEFSKKALIYVHALISWKISPQNKTCKSLNSGHKICTHAQFTHTRSRTHVRTHSHSLESSWHTHTHSLHW